VSADPLKADPVESFLTAHQLAEKLQVSADWVYEQASTGGMPSYRIGTLRRFRISEIEEWLLRHREPRSVAQIHAVAR
jgi:excisionase family DNA binding protein